MGYEWKEEGKEMKWKVNKVQDREIGRKAKRHS